MPQTMLIVFEVVLGFPLFMWRMYGFLRKRKGEQADQVGGWESAAPSIHTASALPVGA